MTVGPGLGFSEFYYTVPPLSRPSKTAEQFAPPGLSPDDVPFSVFPETDTTVAIRDVLDSKAGLALLVFGTIGGVAAVIVGAFTPSSNVPSSADVVAAFAAFALGYGVGWWWTVRPGLRGKQEQRLLVHCFLAWSVNLKIAAVG